MNIEENKSLKPYNTFGINVNARFFLEVNTVLQLQKALQLSAYPNYFILGGGSNMLLLKDIEDLVLHINLKGITVVEEDEDRVIVKAMAGENWHEFVQWTLKQDYGGLENLSLIPGNVGTAPIQNIGAYGVELKDSFVSCEAMHIESQELEEFFTEDCEFGYRDSVFKGKKKGKYIITAVKFKLTKHNHQLHTHYGAIEAELEKLNIVSPTIKDVSNAVINIRKSKLPDPKAIGNSGSFFKNPVISKKTFNAFIRKNKNAPYYELEDGTYKIPAGWLIEQCGFKGKRYGDAGVHSQQALVLVNHDNATGKEILDLAKKIQLCVKDNFNITIDPEVNIIK
ncbi:UDP-N-acetylmuramate dehydrogenase [Croceivirga radicis]|uniref:UDP-N-acetylmuramate dehydrogenase n=1 Tax=Croceivirga radicis TaxID=1929488 RepID=UPI000255B039|nr:UDP-N-acetylmuramate dehydrogenase [Croceivirga radicis]